MAQSDFEQESTADRQRGAACCKATGALPRASPTIHGRIRRPVKRCLMARTRMPRCSPGSDSRVPPEIIFDQGLGDLFTVRTAGQLIDSAVIASLEYAVKKLHVSLICVLGHEHAAQSRPPSRSWTT